MVFQFLYINSFWVTSLVFEISKDHLASRHHIENILRYIFKKVEPDKGGVEVEEYSW